jgi:hypothetical protein
MPRPDHAVVDASLRASSRHGRESGHPSSRWIPAFALRDSHFSSPPRRRGPCVREDALSARWESLPCEVTSHEAEGNCVAARRGGEQPEANGQPAGERTRFGGFALASLRSLAKPGPCERSDRARCGDGESDARNHDVVGGGMSGRQSGVSGETCRSRARRAGVRAFIVPLR